MNFFTGMEKIIKVYRLNDSAQYEDEINYWTNISPEEKLSVLQELREQYIYFFNKQKLYNESRKGLRRVHKITELSQVKYIVVGAYALIYHTYPRNTGDIDFFVEVSDSNTERIMKALQEFGFENPELKK